MLQGAVLSRPLRCWPLIPVQQGPRKHAALAASVASTRRDRMVALVPSGAPSGILRLAPNDCRRRRQPQAGPGEKAGPAGTKQPLKRDAQPAHVRAVAGDENRDLAAHREGFPTGPDGLAVGLAAVRLPAPLVLDDRP